VDHFDPLCDGGSNDKDNQAKDPLEAFICIEVQAQRLDPKVAYNKMTADWVQFYLDNEAKLPKNGGGGE
jgi:hypothetical protein